MTSPPIRSPAHCLKRPILLLTFMVDEMTELTESMCASPRSRRDDDQKTIVIDLREQCTDQKFMRAMIPVKGGESGGGKEEMDKAGKSSINPGFILLIGLKHWMVLPLFHNCSTPPKVSGTSKHAMPACRYPPSITTVTAVDRWGMCLDHASCYPDGP